MRDFDFHPDEETVRTFGVPESGVLVNDNRTCTLQTRQPDSFGTQPDDLVLRHHAFADQWFKLNATYDLRGQLIQPGPPGEAFAVNCDIATPMVRIGADISSVDLFLDVLVDVDGSYRVIDDEEFQRAASAGLISPTEAHRAEAGLIELIHWIETGRLQTVLAATPPEVAAEAPPPLSFVHTPLHLVPTLAPGRRPSW